MQTTEMLTYQDDTLTCQGHVVYPATVSDQTPIILVVHDWSGRNHFAEAKAAALADLGYIGFAIDLYGEGRVGATQAEKTALMKPLAEDRAMLRQRLTAAYEAAKQIKQGNKQAIGAIGFCFGGLSALDLARTGLPLKGVVSFHGLLNAPEELREERIQAKILALHGYNDPMVPPNQVMDFADEMTRSGADWQVLMYGNTVHAFMNPEAKDEASGLVYSPIVAARAWETMKGFFAEVFLT